MAVTLEINNRCIDLHRNLSDAPLKRGSATFRSRPGEVDRRPAAELTSSPTMASSSINGDVDTVGISISAGASGTCITGRSKTGDLIDRMLTGARDQLVQRLGARRTARAVWNGSAQRLGGPGAAVGDPFPGT